MSLFRAVQPVVGSLSVTSALFPPGDVYDKDEDEGLFQLSPLCKIKHKRKRVVCLDRDVTWLESAEIPPQFIPTPSRGRRESREES